MRVSNFTRFRAFSRLPGARKACRLGADLVWDVGKKGSSWPLVINAGTEFDISVPRSLEWLQNPHDTKVLLAAAVHDELLKRGFDPAFASAEFARAARALGTGRWWCAVLFCSTFAITAARRARKRN